MGMPIPGDPNRLKVNFFHSPNGKWFTMLNLRVTFQSPDVVDVEDDSKKAIKDFDQIDEEDETEDSDDDITTIVLKPKAWVEHFQRPEEKETSKEGISIATTMVADFKEQILDHNLTTLHSFTERSEIQTTTAEVTLSSAFTTDIPREETTEEPLYPENDLIPGLDEELKKDLHLHIPHKIRHNGHKHRHKTTIKPLKISPEPFTSTPEMEEIASGVFPDSGVNINVDDEDYSQGSGHLIEEAEEKTEAALTTVAAQVWTKIGVTKSTTPKQTSEPTQTEEQTPSLAEILMTFSPESSTISEGNTTMEGEESIEQLFSNATIMPEEDPENVTISEAELYQMMAREILHEDPLNRDRDKLRILLTNLTQWEFGEIKYEFTHRDFGGSFLLPLLKSREYDNNSAPVVFSDIPVNVLVSLNIIHLTNFDSQQMEYTIDLEMNMVWYDVRLANNYTKPIRVRESYILDQIWKPDPYFNSKFSYFHMVSFPNFRMRIFPDGLVMYTLRVTLLPDCQMTFCRHPHDSQVCDLITSSVAYSENMLKFNWLTVNPVTFSTKVSLPELRIKRLITESCFVEGKLISSSCLRLAFFMERDGARYIVEKYIPSTLAMMFAWVAPYVPYNYEDVRIITPITVLLTLVQMEKGDLEVRTSYLTSMDLWFLAMKIFSVLSLVESLIVLALIKRGRGMDRQAQRAPNEYMRDLYQMEKRRITELYHRLDTASRFLSPIIFVIFFVYYVLYIAQGDERACLPVSRYS